MPSGSDSDSSRSVSPTPSLNHGPVPTPGNGLEQGSRSNSPYNNHSGESRPGSQVSRSNRSRSASASNRSRSRSSSAGSNRSRSSGASRSRSNSVHSNHSEGSHKSGSHKSVASNRSRSKTPASNRSRSVGSNASNKSRSNSEASNKSNHSGRSRSKTPASRRSRSGSERSGSRSSKRSGSVQSNRSPSPSQSVASKRSGSHRSASAASHRSRSRSSESRRSVRSKSRDTNRSPSKERQDSRSNSPILQINTGSNHSSSGSEIGRKRKRKKSSDNSDKEGDEAQQDATALFGDADDISSDEDKEEKEEARLSDHREKDDRGKEDDQSRDQDQDEDRNRERSFNETGEQREDEEMEVEEGGKEPEAIPETRIDVEIPKITTDLGRDIHFVKLPNFLSVETRPFDQETYEDEIDEEETLDEEGRARLKLKVENTIRWRESFDNDGNMQQESNARLIKWSDGSLSLHLGSEIFDVYKQPLQGDHNHLFIRQGTGLQGQAVFRTKLSFRPHSTESFTHRKMTLSLADRSQKTSGIKILSQVGVDPDQDRKFLLKKEEEKLRQTSRAKPRKRNDATGRTHGSSSTYREEEGSEEEGAISLAAIKNKYKSGAAGHKSAANIYSSDEEGSDFEARRVKKTDKSKAIRVSDSETNESD